MHYTARISASVALTVLLLGAPAMSMAATFKTGEQPSLSVGETIAGNLYMVGGNVTSAGSVHGDLIAVGGTVIVSGPVSGDVSGAGGNITVLDTVGGDVRAAGGNIVVQGVVRGDVVVGGGQVNLVGPSIGGDLVVGGGSVRIDAPISGSVRIGGGQVYINAPVAGNIQMQAGEVILGSRAVVQGDLDYKADKVAKFEDGAVVRGETKFEQRADMRGAAKTGIAALMSLLFVAKFFMLFASALVISMIFRRYSRELVRVSVSQPLSVIGRGIVFLIVAPVVSVALLFTVIGIPLGVAGLLAFVVAIIFVTLISPIVAGSMVHKLIFKPVDYEVTWKTILLGALACFLLGFIPLIGWALKFFLTLLVLGAMLQIKRDIITEWR